MIADKSLETLEEKYKDSTYDETICQKCATQVVNELEIGVGNRNKVSTIKETQRDEDNNINNANEIFTT